MPSARIRPASARSRPCRPAIRRPRPRNSNGAPPGWVQTDLGGPAAPLTIEQSIPGVVDTIEAQATKGGLQYLDYQGQTVRW